MARRKVFKSPPETPMNQWVRDAIAYAEEQGGNWTYDEIGDRLTRCALGQVYDKSKIQKMTTIRRVTLAEAQALSQMTGFPLPELQREALSLDERLSRLSPARQTRLRDMLADLEAAEAVDPAGASPRDDQDRQAQ